jgi:hypothetical protein
MTRNLIEERTEGDGLTRRIYDDGTEQVVDAEGKFQPGGKLAPATAASMPKIRKRIGTDDDISDLLDELGMPDSTMANLLANLLIAGGTGAVQAAKELLGMQRNRTGGTLIEWVDDTHTMAVIGGKYYWQIGALDVEHARTLVKFARSAMQESGTET